MNASSYLALRLKEVLLDGKWIANTNVAQATDNLSWEQATKKIGDLNSIAVLTFHLNYYLAGLLRVLNGGPLDIHDKYSFQIEGIHTYEDWLNLRNELLHNAAAMVAKVASLSEAHLTSDFVRREYGTWIRNIDGLIEHSYYHLGQIVLLRKII